MNKFAIPAILLGIVMIAGIFAFMPVNNVSTVHTTIIAAVQGATVVRVETEISNLDDNEDGTWSQIVTYSRNGGAGAFQIEKLFLCDLENFPEESAIIISFDVETNLIDPFEIDNVGNLSTSGPSSSPRSSVIVDDMNDACVDLLDSFSASPIFSGPEFPHTNTRIHLGGDDDNNVRVRILDPNCGEELDADGAFLVAYISGFIDALDVGDDVDNTLGTCV